MKLIAMALLLTTGFLATAQNTLNITPIPAEVKIGKGNVVITKNTQLVIEGSGLEKCSTILNDYLQANYGFKLKIVKSSTAANAITLNFERLDYVIKGAYNLVADKKGIYIAGDNEEGVFYGIQTLFQLFSTPKGKTNQELYVPQVTINDHPRFQYRGLHLDVARHFFPVSYVKKYIDYLAAYKFNTFHWHLTDDQGWRIEIKKYPLLTQVGGFRNGSVVGRYPGKGNDGLKYGGFYTQEEIKEVIKYAADRYITVLPEIEMPGHASAAIAAYPQLSCFPNESTNTDKIPWNGAAKGKQVQQTWGVFEDVFAPTDYTFNFLQDVLDEVMQLFPSKYIHIGGDECPKEAWKKSPFCQQLIKDKNLKDEHGLQSYFIQRIEKYINSKGRNIIGWDEILEGGLAPNATVMSWRGEEGGIEAAKQNHDVIMTPGTYCYLDHSQSKNEDSVTIGGYLPLDKVYNYEPVPAGLNEGQAKHILGAQGNVWTEYIGNPSKVEYMIFPRMIALSEVLWSPKEKRNWTNFEARLPGIFERLDKQHINYGKAYFDLQATVLPTDNNEGVLWKVESKTKNAKIKWIKTLRSSEVLDYDKPILIKENNMGVTASLVNSNDVTLSTVSQSFHFNKATAKKITLVNEPSKNYPGDGAFTLVNGVQNDKGLSRGNEFLGFLGKDLDASIDLGKEMKISKITLHTLYQPGSWIYLPKEIEISWEKEANVSGTGTGLAVVKNFTYSVSDLNNTQVINLPEAKLCRYIRVTAKNYGIIPAGQPGAGTPAWLFADEIEVE